MDETQPSADGDSGRGGDVTVRRMSLRPGGWIGYSDDAIFVDRDDERIRIENRAVTKLSIRQVEWDVAVMSLLLLGIGGWIVATRNPIVGVAFALVGLASLYRTYAKRNRLVIRIENERKPVTVLPEHPEECLETLVASTGLRSASTDPGPESTGPPSDR